VRTLLLVFAFVLGGCRAAPSDAALAGLTRDLQEAFPDRITAISVKNAPPLDPPTIFVDTAPGMSRTEEVDWLCSLVKPRVDAIDNRIDVETTRGSLRTDCGST
jgi:hypothetical protein